MTQTNNPNIRSFFVLPPIRYEQRPAPGKCEQTYNTGDADVDTVLRLRDMVAAGDPTSIETALALFDALNRPRAEIEAAYRAILSAANPGNPFAVFGSFGFCDLRSAAEEATKRASELAEAVSRFGDEYIHLHATVEFCEKALEGADRTRCFVTDDDADRLFGALTDMVPSTLEDILFEMTYWDRLQLLCKAVSGCDLSDATSVRYWYLFRRIVKTPSSSRETALRLFDHLVATENLSVEERGGQREVIRSLIAGR